MASIAQAVILSWGWRRFALAFAVGAISALAQAPFHLAPILFVTLPVLVWLIDGSVSPHGRRPRGLLPAALVGWWFGFGYFFAGLYWIGAAFLVEADVFGWMMPFAVIALPAGLALFHGLGAALARLIWVEGPLRIFAFAIGLLTAEWLRGHVLTGFPWNLFGQAVAFTDVTAQAASVVGVYGLTALGLVVFAAPAALVEPSGARPLARRFVAGFTLLVIIVDIGFGVGRLAGAPTVRPDDRGGVRIRIVQPAINQAQKWSPEYRSTTLDTLLALSDRKTDPETLGAMSFGLVVWPETALPFFLTEEPEALGRISTLIPAGTVLVTGAPRVEPAGEQNRFYNSIYAIAGGGRILGAYDKVHLVPFGEYLPLEGLLSRLGLRQIVPAVGGFSAGPARHTLELPGIGRAGFLVCYEVIFSGEVIDRSDRPDVLINITNDGWFGDTAGPHQHLDQARLRAIEEGLPLLRAANTGISSVIDAYGRIVAHLDLGERGVLDAVLPAEKPSTIFPLAGASFLFTFYVFSVIVVLAGGRKRNLKR